MTHKPTHQAQALDALILQLHGRQVIEASAGTGKTWTPAALYVRLVLGHLRNDALLPPQILVMTFTDAATAELRDRIRIRLSQAAAYFDASAQNRTLPQGLKPDQFLVSLRDSFDPSLWPRCALQLNCAAEWMDDAAIYTIHGWSRRMLSQHALDSRNLFEQTHLDNAEDMQRTLVQDYWREWFTHLAQTRCNTSRHSLAMHLMICWPRYKAFGAIKSAHPKQSKRLTPRPHNWWQHTWLGKQKWKPKPHTPAPCGATAFGKP
jgi:ATP-dependent exoDNAse (exonuclease V) beta subunit